MIEGSHYWMKKVPMRAEGILGHTWRKDKYHCDLCDKSFEPKEDIGKVVKHDFKFKVACSECRKEYKLDPV